jgi:transcriptional regulator with XRE-family HTH domain
LDERGLRAILGKNVKYFRFHRQLSQADLAEKAGISITFVSNIERGNNFPKAGTLCNLAKALDIAVWELFKDEVTPDESKTVVDRLSDDVKRRVIGALDEVFGHYQG